jgi:hypothetical protein
MNSTLKINFYIFWNIIIIYLKGYKIYRSYDF